ncbi:MAG: ATP-binding cassette domain-containing protein [Gracilibacteraceae bacterium]|jgi:NitT/TauT family transport system ATP-binding protein|nr:ATP-binding cassette domain-containing protein [Gracilibacteraceae bacterium]
MTAHLKDIVISDLYKSFGAGAVLRGFSCRIPAGGKVCVTGASGQGKTTLLRILMGLETADAGTVSGLDGQRLSAVFQEDRLCENLSAFSNVMMVNKGSLRRAAVIAALEAVGLKGHEYRPVRELSGGMRRRAVITRALLAEYDVLFLDEPFKGLDEDTHRTVMTFAREKSQGKTVILVTHDPREGEFIGAVRVQLPDAGA